MSVPFPPSPESSLGNSSVDSSGITTRAQHRKRVLSGADEEPAVPQRPWKISRVKSWYLQRERSVSHDLSYDRMPSVSREDGDYDGDYFSSELPPPTPRSRFVSPAPSERSLSRRPSISGLSEGMGLMRTLSSSSLSDLRSPVIQPPVPESASNHLRGGKFIIDFSVSDEVLKAGAYPVSWSENNYMVFGRGNRVYYKNFSANEDINQVCKVPEGLGNLRAVQCGGKDQRNNVAIITMKGIIQIWDLSTKKMTLSWPTKRTPTVMHWNGPILSVGGERGSIRHFDTRIHEARKPVNPVHKVTRHQSKISSLLWNPDGGFFASGDEGGTVHVWDSRQKSPLEVGELVQRRRKMQHVGAVTALAWCPWQSKLLASGDSAPDATGTICVWNINNTSSSQPNYPMKLELDAQITSLHFSAHCKELLSTHGPGKSTPAPPPSVQLDSHSFPNETMPSRIANSVVVHAIPSLRQVVKLEAAKVNIAGSVMSPNGQRIVLAVPEESKLKVWDVWGKKKELKRTSSSLTLQIR